MLNVLTVDVEEYFHPSEVRGEVDVADWERMPPRVEITTRRALELLARHRSTGTFFVLGWVAHHYPRLVREIAEAGHEIGCHGYSHQLVYEMTPAEFRRDTERARDAIEYACGVAPRVYRATSYSITARCLWALDVLTDCGFTHDSSIYPISHDRYGIPGFGRHMQVVQTASGPLVEVPIATVQLSRRKVAPVGGGAYLRLMPYRYVAAGIRTINQREGEPACVYFHPWELDPQQPRLACNWMSRIRTYAGLSGMEAKLGRLLSEFRFAALTAVHPAPAQDRSVAEVFAD